MGAANESSIPGAALASPLTRDQLLGLVRARWAPGATDLRWSASPLRGGLDSASVQRLDLFYRDRRGAHERALVVKILEQQATREATLYQEWVRHLPRTLRPEPLATIWLGSERCALVLEFVPSAVDWPWRDLGTSAELLRTLASLHREAAPPALRRGWNYDAALAASGRNLLAFLDQRPRLGGDFAYARRARPAVRRLLDALPRIRRQLLECRQFPACPLHGDVHPGNALVRRHEGGFAPVLIDWGRARIGSPLEDVSSWLQSLGYWEPAAKRRHDTLLRQHLVARGAGDRLDRELRAAYWLAGACNVLAGAALYHLWRARDGAGVEARRRSHRAAADALRILRRADACWN